MDTFTRKLVQVGMGSHGNRWRQVVLANSRWQYAAVATLSTSERETNINHLGLPRSCVTETLAQALSAAPDADAVLITTPYFQHVSDISVALQHQKDVLVEKPLAGNEEDVEEILAAARCTDSIIMVSENYRFREAARLLYEILSNGEIGPVEMVNIEYFVRHQFSIGDWRNELSYPVLIENNTHHIDLLRYFLGCEVSAVTANVNGSATDTPWQYPSVAALIEMESGAQVTFSASWAYPSLETQWEGSWSLRGPKGTLQWNKAGISLGLEGRQRQIAVHESSECLDLVLKEFTYAIDEKRTPSVDLEDNARTLKVVLAMIQSSQKRRRIVLRKGV